MTRPFLLALLSSLAIPAAHCQKTESWFDYHWHKTDVSHARFYSIIEKTDSGWHRKDYYLRSLTLQMEGLYADSACKVPSGHFRSIHPTRMVGSTGIYRAGKKQGLWLCYYSDGALADSTVYDKGDPVGIRISWYRTGDLRDSASYRPDGSGACIAWFDNGNPSFAGYFAPGYKKYGKWQYFYKAGGISATEVYDPTGHLQSKNFYDERGVLQKDTVNDDREPSFPGGAQAWADYLSRALYFPDHFKVPNGDEPTVIVRAVIGEDGKVTDAEVEVPFYPAFDRVALEAVRRSPGWIPAMDHHRKVKGEVLQPVTFSQPAP